jgi:hypothetical protein
LNGGVGGSCHPIKETHMDTLNHRNPRPNRLAIVDVIAMVAIALGIGLAASIVLGGAVLLFSGGSSPVIADAAAIHVAALGRP